MWNAFFAFHICTAFLPASFNCLSGTQAMALTSASLFICR